jgi:hypothetical protein
MYGMRTVASDEIRGVYGNGYVFYPAVSVTLPKGFYVGAGYEGGYSRSGLIGIFEDPTRLKVSGAEAFAGYELKTRAVRLYAKAGLGFYRYKQSIDFPGLPYEIDGRKSAPLAALGARLFAFKGLFVITELKYVSMKVRPVDVEVDLGGIRLLGGLGYRF